MRKKPIFDISLWETERTIYEGLSFKKILLHVKRIDKESFLKDEDHGV